MARCICLSEEGACSKTRHDYLQTGRQNSILPGTKEEQTATRLSHQFNAYFSKILVKHSGMERWYFLACLAFFPVCMSLEIALSCYFNFILPCFPPAREQILMQVLIHCVDLYPHGAVIDQGYPPQMDETNKKPLLTPKPEIQIWNKTK